MCIEQLSGELQSRSGNLRFLFWSAKTLLKFTLERSEGLQKQSFCIPRILFLKRKLVLGVLVQVLANRFHDSVIIAFKLDW